MKKLCDIFNIDNNTIIKNICTNSKEVTKGSLFVCIKGVKEDRHKYIKEAIKNGASALVVSKKVKIKNIPIIRVKNTNEALIDICNKFYDYPESKLEIIGVTGTDGKTTTSIIISSLLKCGYIGTLGAWYKDYKISLNNTTPSLELRYKILNEFIKRGCKTVVMEVSSESIYHKRIDKTTFSKSLLTNITEDHLNIHKTIENYVNCKAKVFNNTSNKGYCILNIDDKFYNYIKEKCTGNILTYGFNKKADLRILGYKYNINKMKFYLKYKNKIYKFKTNLIGKYNLYNITSSILILLSKNISTRKIKKKITKIKSIPGRFEVFKTYKNSYIVLDYAHTTNGLYSILTLLNNIKQRKIITITGSAGGREKQKRPSMGKVVTNLSDFVIFTMDDPRYENPQKIINQMISKTTKKNYSIILNRKKAIKEAIHMSKENDIILLAGKGRDEYMLIKDKKIPYNDYEEIKKWTS